MKISSSRPADAYMGIHLFNESGLPLPVNRSICQKIAALIEKNESCHFQLVEVAFVDEENIVRVNQEHFERDYITDVISFRYDESAGNQAVEGTLYCCAPRINEQAAEYNQPSQTEFKRIIIHGLLHLVGYEDQSETSKKQMGEREDFYIEQLQH